MTSEQNDHVRSSSSSIDGSAVSFCKIHVQLGIYYLDRRHKVIILHPPATTSIWSTHIYTVNYLSRLVHSDTCRLPLSLSTVLSLTFSCKQYHHQCNYSYYIQNNNSADGFAARKYPTNIPWSSFSCNKLGINPHIQAATNKTRSTTTILRRCMYIWISRPSVVDLCCCRAWSIGS